jgi:hypothetical protein
MRQRVLLVAGWVVAAAVTSLVASGAVAVAGGQVNDRPLTRVLAADVAALPVVNTEGVPDPCEPPASGGFDCGPGAPSAGAQSDGPGSSDSAGGGNDNDLTQLDPNQPDGFTPSIDVGTPEDAGPENLVPQPGLPEPIPAQYVSVDGGSVSFYVEDDRVQVRVIVPGFGYSYVIDESGEPTVLRVSFIPNPRLAGPANAELSGAEAQWVDGELVVETFGF